MNKKTINYIISNTVCDYITAFLCVWSNPSARNSYFEAGKQ